MTILPKISTIVDIKLSDKVFGYNKINYIDFPARAFTQTITITVDKKHGTKKCNLICSVILNGHFS